MSYTLPTISATVPTVIGGVTYGVWAVQTAIVLDPVEANAPADGNGPHWPGRFSVVCIKGRIHPDGYFQPSPVDAPMVFQLDDCLKSAQGSATLQNVLNTVVTFISNQGKAKGLL